MLAKIRYWCIESRYFHAASKSDGFCRRLFRKCRFFVINLRSWRQCGLNLLPCTDLTKLGTKWSTAFQWHILLGLYVLIFLYNVLLHTLQHPRCRCQHRINSCLMLQVLAKPTGMFERKSVRGQADNEHRTSPVPLLWNQSSHVCMLLLCANILFALGLWSY